MSSSSWAEGHKKPNSLDTYALSGLEYCEIYMSWVNDAHPDYGSDQYVKCQSMNLFQPIRKLEASRTNEPVQNSLSLSSSKTKNWPFSDLSIKTVSGKRGFEDPKMTFNGYDYNLSEYIFGRNKGYRSIEVGHSGEAVIIRLLERSITQLTIEPSHCEDGSIEYTVKQVLSWYPPFLDDSYHKTFIKTPTCN